MKKFIIMLIVALGATPVMAEEAKVTPLMSKDIAGFPGKELVFIAVEYPPGHQDPIHRHNAQSFVYVVQGSVIMQVRGGQRVTLRPGQTFYEGPEDVHVIGRNASRTKPARILVYLIKNKDTPVLVPAE
jgi:quercetin dioxygenase-like cupin family protein